MILTDNKSYKKKKGAI